jgi:hypothetical protein
MSRRGASLSVILSALRNGEWNERFALAEINSAPYGLSAWRRFKKSNAWFKVSNATHRNFSCVIDLGLIFISPFDFTSTVEMVLHVQSSSYRKG